jgi:hypothetical protein
MCTICNRMLANSKQDCPHCFPSIIFLTGDAVDVPGYEHLGTGVITRIITTPHCQFEVVFKNGLWGVFDKNQLAYNYKVVAALMPTEKTIHIVDHEREAWIKQECECGSHNPVGHGHSDWCPFFTQEF